MPPPVPSEALPEGEGEVGVPSRGARRSAVAAEGGEGRCRLRGGEGAGEGSASPAYRVREPPPRRTCLRRQGERMRC